MKTNYPTYAHFQPHFNRDGVLSYEMRTADEGDIVKAHLSYDKGGTNYFNYKQEPRGVRLSITPCHRELTTYGHSEAYSLLTGGEQKSGLRFFVLPLERGNPKKLSEAAGKLDAAVWEAANLWPTDIEQAKELIRAALDSVSKPEERVLARAKAERVPVVTPKPVMKLLTEEIKARLPKIGAQEQVEDPIVHVKFFHPASNWTWYATEGEQQEGDWLFFGRVDGAESELGYFRLSELEEIHVRGLGVERDRGFGPVPLSQCRNTAVAA